MELFVHTQGSGEAEIVTVEETALVGTLVAHGSGHRVWIDEQAEEVQLDVTFVEAGIHHHHHVHRGRCHALQVDVRFETTHKNDEVRSSATIGQVLSWAVGKEGFGLPDDQRPKYVLALPSAKDYLPSDVRLITLVGEDCVAHLDLQPMDHFGG